MHLRLQRMKINVHPWEENNSFTTDNKLIHCKHHELKKSNCTFVKNQNKSYLSNKKNNF